jgi:hypothetical protein
VRRDRIEVQPLLLNPGDWLQIQALVDGLDAEQIRLSARVEGVSELRAIADGGVSLPARLARETAVAALASVGALLAAGTALGLLVFSIGDRTDDQVVQASGQRLCATSVTYSGDKVLLVLRDGGVLRDLPRAEVRAVRKDAC